MANFRVIVTPTVYGPGWTVTKYNGSTFVWDTLISYTSANITGTDTYPNYLWATAALNLSSGDVVSWKLASTYSTHIVLVSGLSSSLWTDSTNLVLTTSYQNKTVKSNNTNNRDLVTAAQWTAIYGGQLYGAALNAYFQDYIEPDQTMTVSAPSNVFSTDTSFDVAISGATDGDVVKIMTVPGNVEAGSLFISSSGALNVTATSQLPATGASQNYKLVVYRTDNTTYDGKGTSYILDVTNGTFTVSKVLEPNTSFSYASTVALDAPVTGFTVALSASAGSINTSVTSYRLVLQGTSTVVSAAITGFINPLVSTDVPAAGSSKTYQIQSAISAGNGGTGGWTTVPGVNIVVTVSYLVANTSFSYASTVALSPPVTGFTVALSASGGSINTGVTSYRLIISGTSTVVSAVITGFSNPLVSTDVPTAGNSKTYQIQSAISSGSGGTGGWATVPGVNIVVTVASFLVANTSFSYLPNPITLAQSAIDFTITISSGNNSINTGDTRYQIVIASSGTVVSPERLDFGTLTSTDVPTTGSKTYQIQSKINLVDGGSGIWANAPGATLVVTAGTWPVLGVTITSNITIDDQDATFPIVINDTGVDTYYRIVETNSIGSTASDLGVSGNATTTSLTLTMPSQQVTTIPADTDFPAGTTRYYKIQGKVTAANGGNDTYYNTTSSSLITVYKVFRAADTTFTASPVSQNVAYSATSFNININDIGSPATDSAWTQYRVCIDNTGAVIAGATRLGPGVIGVGHVPSSGSVTYKIQASAPNDDNSKGDGSWSTVAIGNTFTVTRDAEVFYGFQHLNSAGTVVADATKPTKTVLQIDAAVTITLQPPNVSSAGSWTTLAVVGVSSQQDLEDNYIFERTDAGGIIQALSGNDNTFDIDWSSAGYVKFTYNSTVCLDANLNVIPCTSANNISNTFDIFVTGKTL